MLKPTFRNIITQASKHDAPPTPLLTIFLGANDACLAPNRGEYVPLPDFEANIRDFVDQVLTNDEMANTKIVLITPPPINIRKPLPMGPEDSPVDPQKDQGYKTYMSKKKYAEKIMQIAASHEDTSRVVGLDLWKALVNAALKDQDRLGDPDAYDELRLPGCGLDGVEEFKPGYFTDGLHFDKLVCHTLLTDCCVELGYTNQRTGLRRPLAVIARSHTKHMARARTGAHRTVGPTAASCRSCARAG
jgi:lysophospholipase L1-like esterase